MTAAQQTSYTVSRIKGLPVLGVLLPTFRTPLKFMMEVAQRYGDIVCMRVLGQDAIQINHPDLIRYVLVENHKNYRKSLAYVRFESAIGLGLLTSNGEKWKRDRQKIQPLFHRTWISDYHFEIVNEVSEKYKRKWLALTEHGKAEINITAEMANITTEVILKAIFGKKIDDETVLSLHHSYDVLVDYLKSLRLFPTVDLRKFFRTPSYLRFKKELDNVDGHIRRLSQQYRDGGLDDKYNMLALLIEAQKNDPANFSERDIRDHAASMVFAGFESTSILMQWLWYVLDERADIKAKLREDIVTHAPCAAAADSSGLTFESIQKMDYLAAVIKETLRLYPSFWMTGRQPLEDDAFGDFKVKRGTWIVVPHFAMHRHPRWWKEPNSYIPERFLHGNEEKINEYVYLPFSQGPRKCSGQAFAEMEAKTIMAKLLPFFDVTALNKLNNDIYAGVSLKLKHPLMAEIARC